MDEDKLRLISYGKTVLKTGQEPKLTQERQEALPTGVSFLSMLGSEISQNNVISRLWSRAKIYSLSQAEAPANWNPRREIKGFFKDYEDFLLEANNPEEMEYRKQLVIQQINYNRMLARSGLLKTASASLLACFFDPLTYVSFGVVGALGGNALLRGATAMGLGRVTSSALHGAVLTAGASAIETTALKNIGASPDNPEYHVVSSAIGGSLFGAVAGLIGKGLAYSRFKIEYGKEAKGDYAFRVFERSDVAKRQFDAHIHPMWKTPEQQLQFHKLLHENVDKYLKWEQPAQTDKVFTMKELGAHNSKEAFLKSLGWTDKADKLMTGGTSKLMDWVGSRLSNQKTLLVSDNEYVKTAGFKIWRTNYSDNAVKDMVGSAEPVDSYVNRNMISNMNVTEMEMRKCYKEELKKAKEQGRNHLTRREMGEQGVDVLLRGRDALEAVDNPEIKNMAKLAQDNCKRAGEDLHKRGGYESQRNMRQTHDDRVGYLTHELQKAEQQLEKATAKKERQLKSKRIKNEALQYEGLLDSDEKIKALEEKVAELNKAIHEENSIFETEFNAFDINSAVEAMGGTYFPFRYNVNTIASMGKEKVNQRFSEAILSQRQKDLKRYRKRSSNIVERMDDSLFTIENGSVRNKRLWKNYLDLADKNYMYVREYSNAKKKLINIYKSPLKDETTAEEARKLLSECEFEINPEFEKVVVPEQADLERLSICDSGFHLKTPAGLQGVKGSLQDLLREPEQNTYEIYRGSARRRSNLMDYSMLTDFADKDMMKILLEYNRAMYGASAMMDAFGDVEAKAFSEAMKRSVNMEEKAILDAGGANASARVRKLKSDREREYRAFRSAIDHILGRSAIDWGSIGEDSVIRHIIGTASNWNVARFLSDCVFSQFQDVANVCLAQDGWRTFGRVIFNGFKFMFNPELRREYAQQMRDFGVGGSLFVESMRSKPLVSISEQYGFWSKAEAVSGEVAEKAIQISGVNMMDAHTQCCASYMATCELERMGKALAEGKQFTDFQVRLAKDYNLDSAKIRRIYEEMEAHSTHTDDVFSINVSKWDDQALADDVRHMMYNVGVSATMVPGSELPNIFRTTIGKMLLQFKSFTTATFGRMFVPSFERGTNTVVNTMLMCIFLGTMSRLCKGFGKWGEKKVKDPVTGAYREELTSDIVYDALTHSVKDMDILAWCCDPTGLLGMLSSTGNFQPSSNGSLESVYRDLTGGFNWVSRKLSGERTTEQQFRSFMRMVPFQNYWMIRACLAGYRNLFDTEKQLEDNK